MSSDQQTAPPKSLLRRLLFPLIVLFVFGGIFAAPWIGLACGYDADELFEIPLVMMTPIALPIGVLLLLVWWVFFSGFLWQTKLCGIVGAALTVCGFLLSLDDFGLTMARFGLKPTVRYKWEKSPHDRLLEQLRLHAHKTDDLPALDATVGPEDFASYRGTKLDGVVSHVKLQTDWQQHPPKLLWQHPCVGGYSGIAVAGNIVVTVEQRGADEVIVCRDRATGRERWVFAQQGAHHKDVMGDGPRATPTIHDGRIYSLGAVGDLVCLSVDGKTKHWSINILEDAKATKIQWGMTSSPLIMDDLVVVLAGNTPDTATGSSLIAYEQASGKKRWAAGDRPAGYSSPQLATFGGKSQILVFAGDALVGCDPKTGKELWNFPWPTQYQMNSIQPLLFDGDRVFISSEADQGCAMLKIKAPDNDSGSWSVETVWKSRSLAARFANPVTDGKSIWGLHGTEGTLTCVDVADGKRQWRGERCGPGQLLLAGDTLILVNGDGVVSLVKADSAAFTELARHSVFGKKTWNTPALAGDQLFLRNQEEIACLRLPRK